jgi:hypothetical protein
MVPAACLTGKNARENSGVADLHTTIDWLYNVLCEKIMVTIIQPGEVV